MNTLKVWAAIMTTGVGVLVPQLIPQYVAPIPKDDQLLATAIAGVLVAAWHRYQPSPSAAKE